MADRSGLRIARRFGCQNVVLESDAIKEFLDIFSYWHLTLLHNSQRIVTVIRLAVQQAENLQPDTMFFLNLLISRGKQRNSLWLRGPQLKQSTEPWY